MSKAASRTIESQTAAADQFLNHPKPKVERQDVLETLGPLDQRLADLAMCEPAFWTCKRLIKGLYTNESNE